MSDEPWTIGRLLMWTIDYLKKHGAENPRLDAEVLLSRARGCQRIDLYAAYGEEASNELRATFRDLVSRRAQGMPVAYLVGHKEFYSLDFEVTPEVLIPRPETEQLVVSLLDWVKGKGAGALGAEDLGLGVGERIESPQPLAPSLRVADVGTGSGILAVCAAKFLPQATVTAIDVSPAALTVARKNAERHGVVDRVRFLESDLFASVPEGEQFDVIVSNPPYVSTAEMAELPEEVKKYEPHVALEAGETGTAVIEPLVAQAADRLVPRGLLLIEISPMIAGAMEQLVRDSGGFELLPTLRDGAGHARVIQARRS